MFFAQKKSELAKNAKIHAFDAKISGEIDKTISNDARDGILSFRSRKPIKTIKIGNILWAVHNNSLQKPVRAGWRKPMMVSPVQMLLCIAISAGPRPGSGCNAAQVLRWLKNMVHNASLAFLSA